MAIQVRKEELLRSGARIHLDPAKPFKVALATSPPATPAPDVSQLANAIQQLGAALAAARDEQRAEIIHAISVNEQIASAMLALRDRALVNVDVHIVSRDALGRILDVQFRSPKP